MFDFFLTIRPFFDLCVYAPRDETRAFRFLPFNIQFPIQMQTLTFTQKLLRQRRFLSFLLPLFAIFVGMAASFNAQATTVLSNSTVQLSRNGGATETFNVSNPSTPNPYDGTRLGTYDINSTNGLVIKGGSITATTSGTSTATSAVLNYAVTDSLGNLVNSGTINLSTIATSGSARTFSNTTANINVLAGISTSGSGYTLSLDYLVRGSNPATARDDNFGNNYNAFFNVSGTLAPPPTVMANTITFDPNGVPPATPQNPSPSNSFETYNINPPTPNSFQGANLSASATGGAYDVNSGQLLLSGTSVTVTQAGPVNIASVVLYYRTRPLNGAATSAFQPITLTETGGSTSTTKTFVLDPSQGGTGLSQPNLIATPSVTQAGTYVLEVYYQANGFNSATGNTVTITDPPTANTYYTAFFSVSGTPIAQTIWTGGFNDNWFDVRNWSNGVPNSGINALVRDLGAGNSVPYPNVNSDSRKLTQAGAVLYDNTGSGPARTRNLVLGGTSQASRSICRLEQGQLQVYGDFSNIQDSFIQRENTIMEFAGTNQTISNGSFIRVDISGGGNKALSGIMNISQSLNFLTGVQTGDQPAAINPYTPASADAGVLSTNISTPGANVVILADRGLLNANNGAQVTGETDDSFLYGFVRTSRVGVLVGETRTYGNLGMTLTFGDARNTNNPGIVEVTRNTVEAYSPVSSRYGIRRIFGVRPSDPQTTTGGLVAAMEFRYRDAETRNLNGTTTSTPGTSSIPEPNLIIFLSSNSGNTFGAVGRDGAVDVVNNVVRKTGVTNFATFTLGDQNNPLPVRLTAFDAKRLGNSALVTWQTATEENSKGYEVQSSTDGKEFRTVTYVPSAAPNSTKLTNYSYEDKTTYNVNTVYYRLHQIDLDGKDAYFGPRTVNFDGKAVAATLVAYPNPYDSNDELHLAVQSDDAGKGRLRITDMTGRMVREESIELNKGVSDMAVSGMKELKSGIYLMRVTLPSGATQNLKVVKQ
jgi:hypothetical protein